MFAGSFKHLFDPYFNRFAVDPTAAESCTLILRKPANRECDLQFPCSPLLSLLRQFLGHHNEVHR
jgi:hypothetical protein